MKLLIMFPAFFIKLNILLYHVNFHAARTLLLITIYEFIGDHELSQKRGEPSSSDMLVHTNKISLGSGLHKQNCNGMPQLITPGVI